MKKLFDTKNKMLALIATTVMLFSFGASAAQAQNYGGCNFSVSAYNTYTSLKMSQTCALYQFRAQHKYYKNDNSTQTFIAYGTWVYTNNAVSTASGGAGTFWADSGWQVANR